MVGLHCIGLLIACTMCVMPPIPVATGLRGSHMCWRTLGGTGREQEGAEASAAGIAGGGRGRREACASPSLSAPLAAALPCLPGPRLALCSPGQFAPHPAHDPGQGPSPGALLSASQADFLVI